MPHDRVAAGEGGDRHLLQHRAERGAKPQLARSEARTGYLLGKHTWSHPNMTTLSAAAQAAQMDEAIAEQKTLIGAPPWAFRPPGGTVTRRPSAWRGSAR